MVVGEMAEPVDLLVVGGGPGGYAAALRAAQLGRQVTLVERGGRSALGGTCLHVGCIPSKALIELAEHRAVLPGLADRGLVVDASEVVLDRFQTWKQGITSGLARGVDKLLSNAGVVVVEGQLRFNRHDRAAVQTPDGQVRFLEFSQAIVATGSRPVELSAFPVDGERVLDSTGALALTDVPDRAVVLGGGYIGIELGTALCKLGSDVTIVEALDRLLPTMDAELSAPLAKRLGQLGVDVRTGSRATDFDGEQLTVEDAAGTHLLETDVVIVAVGRRPNTDELGLAQAGVEVDGRGLIPVGSDLLATERIAAIGDVIAGPALAHKAMHEGIVAAEALSGQTSVMDAATIPSVVFSDPELAVTGLTRGEATAAGLDVRSARFPFSASGRAATLDSTEGFVQVVSEAATGRVLGVQIVGSHASELITEASLAIEMVATVDDVAATIHPHPTMSEALGEAASIIAGYPVHVQGVPR